LFIAPTIAYFANTIDTISAIYFISKEKFIISSPSDFASYIQGDTFDSVVNSRPYWINTIRFGLTQQKDRVVYTGQYDDYLTGKKVVTLTKGIYVDGDRISVSVSGGATLYSLYKFDSLAHLWQNQSIRASDE
jgi:hypothetical protein